MKMILLTLAVFVVITVMGLGYLKYQSKSLPTYKNTHIDYKTEASTLWQVLKSYATVKREAAIPQTTIPVNSITKAQLEQLTEDTVIRLGHSTLLLKLDNQLILLDPVFSERASPVQWAGPKRFHQPPINIEDLPFIDAVIISHDHYDHLDEAAIKQLANKVDQFITPKGVGRYLTKWGVNSKKVTELEWWQTTQVNSLVVTATPAQHFSGRGLFDKDTSLWASWVLTGAKNKVFFSGDTGYFAGFKEIGERFGPFDLTLIETGAYNTLWQDIHMLPEESVQANIDLQGKAMMPIHNGTFDLALHDWFEPFERVTTAAENRQVKLLTPEFGQPLALGQEQTYSAWWQEITATKPKHASTLCLNHVEKC